MMKKIAFVLLLCSIAIAQTGLVYEVSITIDKQDNAVLEEINVRSGQDSERGDAGDYNLEFLTEGGEVVWSRFYDVSFWLSSNRPIPIDESGIGDSIPYQPSASHLRLSHLGKVILDEDISYLQCDNNSVCGEHENAAFCLSDCPRGGSDEYCAPEEFDENDGVCDPDCSSYTDLDCTCGNGVCDPQVRYGENYPTCPADCPSGSTDEYCDGVKDGKYDTDCDVIQDPDCAGNAQWCLDQFYKKAFGPTATPESGVTATYSFSGRDMVVEIAKPAQGELPAGAEAQIKTDMQAMFTVLNMNATGTTAKVVNGQLVVTTTVKNLLSESLAATFTPVPEYKTVVKGAQTIAPTPDSLENGVATYNIAPASITVSYGGEAGFDWLLWAVVVLVLIIGAWLVKRNLR